MLKKTITAHALSLLLLGGAVSFSTVSCTSTDRQEAAADTDEAYNDFKTFVASTETNAENVADKTQAEWEQETNQLKSDYDAKMAAAESSMDSWTDERKAEYEQLKTRYTTAYDRRVASYNNNMMPDKPGQYYSPMTPAAGLTAANARERYEKFVNNVKQNEDKYDIQDWRYINAEWRALDEAYDQVKGDIPASDLAEIQKEKLKYAAFKSFDKTEARVAQGADAVSGEAREVSAETADERSAVRRAASNTASDVKDAGKTVGQKIGNAAEKVGQKTKEGYKEVKSEIKNTDND